MTRQFKFNGYHDEPYFGYGKFTVGVVYATEEVEYEGEDDVVPPDAEFKDDNGDSLTEEIQYFTEVTNE